MTLNAVKGGPLARAAAALADAWACGHFGRTDVSAGRRGDEQRPRRQ
jgi:hypothetical protein